MTKQELLETYTAEQLADKVIELETIIDDKLGGWSKHGISYNDFFSMQDENKKLKSEVEKYRKSFEDAKKECDCQIAEYQKKIKKLEKKSDFYFPEEPIKIADLIIHGWETSWDYKNLSISELRQIAEHLLVYCNHNGEDN